MLPGHATPLDIGVADGRIAALHTALPSGPPEHDAAGRLVCAGLVETHIHLDKAGILDRCRLCNGTLAEAVAETARAKASFTERDVHDRARRVVEAAILHGTQRMRSFVEIDPSAGFRSFVAIKELRRAYAWAIDLEICAFVQDGLTNHPATIDMIDAALTDGADLIGGCPYTDPDPVAHIGIVFDLAQRHDVAVDFHVDFDLDPTCSDLPEIIRQTDARGWGGRVSVGHATKLSAIPPTDCDATARRLARAGIAVTVLPATDLYLNGRAATHLIPRGVAPAHRLAEHGVVTSIATNNVLNPFTPFGDASLIRMANLYANVAQLGSDEALSGIFRMITDDAARLLGRGDYGIGVGASADLVLIEAASSAAAIATIAPVLAGWRAGRPSFIRPPASLLPPADTPT